MWKSQCAWLHSAPWGDSPLKPPPNVERKLASLPDEPGVYLWKDADGAVAYVGKAKRLRTRVRGYFGSDGALSPKTEMLVRAIGDLETECPLVEIDRASLFQHPDHRVDSLGHRRLPL